MSKIGIAGAGAWGTALAAAMVRAGNEVVIQALEPEVAEAINKRHENAIYLPGVAL
ncbi:MAG: NAD(P)-binding domain-containing protein, partial [Rhodospirillales bacterium]